MAEKRKVTPKAPKAKKSSHKKEVAERTTRKAARRLPVHH